MSAPLHEYDKDTVQYLKLKGIDGELLDRVRRLAQEAAELRIKVQDLEGIAALCRKLEQVSP